MTPSTDAGSAERAKACAERGEVFWKQGLCSAAIEWFTRALETNPDDAWTLLRRGAARAALEDLAGASRDFRQAGPQLAGPAHASQRSWAASQWGEGLRLSLRDAALAPDADVHDVQGLLKQIDTALAAFDEALHAQPDSAWAHAHHGALSVLAYWVEARFGVDPAQARHHRDAARRELDTALRLKKDYGWAAVFKATLLTVMGAQHPEGPERKALFDEAAKQMEAAGRMDARLEVLHPLTEFALYQREYNQTVERGVARLARDPEDLVARYCVAAALQAGAATRTTDGVAVEAARREAAQAFTRQTRKALLAKRSRLASLLGGLAVLEGQYDVAAEHLREVLEYPDLETVVFLWCDPSWAPIRQDAARTDGEPRLGAVTEAYARLFPRAFATPASTPLMDPP